MMLRIPVLLLDADPRQIKSKESIVIGYNKFYPEPVPPFLFGTVGGEK
jgi:hypothetical protein